MESSEAREKGRWFSLERIISVRRRRARERSTERRRSTTFDSTGKANRNKYRLEDKDLLDGHRCVITGTRDPHIGYIVPFAANATENGRLRWRGLLLASMGLIMQDKPNNVKPRTFKTRIFSLFTFEQGVIDRHWKCISLSQPFTTGGEEGIMALRTYLPRYDRHQYPRPWRHRSATHPVPLDAVETQGGWSEADAAWTLKGEHYSRLSGISDSVLLSWQP